MHIHTQSEQVRVAPANLNYAANIRYITKHTKWILGSIGIWPAVEHGAGRFIPEVAIVFGNLVLCFAMVPCALHITYNEKNITMKLKLIGLLSFLMAAMVKYWSLAAHRSEIKNCVDNVKTDWKLVELERDRELMLKYGKLGRNLTIMSATFMYSAGFLYHTVMPYVNGRTANYNTSMGIKPLVYPHYSALYDVQSSPIYEFVYLAQCICGYVMYSVTSGACGLAALFATHVCSQIDIVISRLDDLVDGKLAKDDSNPDKRLKSIVEHHLRILKFSAMVDKILQEVCLVEFVGSTCMICLLEYYCLVDWQQSNAISLANYALLLVSLTFNIFILCYIGQLLMEKTSNVGISCFVIDWYRLPAKTMRGLVLVIAMLNNPAKISAGRMVDLSVATFGSVLKTSLAYLSFIRTAVT